MDTGLTAVKRRQSRENSFSDRLTKPGKIAAFVLTIVEDVSGTDGDDMLFCIIKIICDKGILGMMVRRDWVFGDYASIFTIYGFGPVKVGIIRKHSIGVCR